MIIAVTGATGFIGRSLVPRLIREHQVRLLLRREPALSSLPLQVSWVGADLSDPPTLGPALRGVDTLFHLAGTMERAGGSAAEMNRVNVEGTEALAGAAARAGIRHFIHLSSARVYGRRLRSGSPPEDCALAPETPYEVSKLEGEKRVAAVCKDERLSLTILRPTGIFGPGRDDQRSFFADSAKRRFRWVGPNRVWVHPLYIEDLTEVMTRLVTIVPEVTEIYNLGGPEPIPYSRWIERVSAAGGGKCRVRELAMPFALPLARGVVRGLWALRGGTWTDGMARRVCPDLYRTVHSQKARRRLGFSPRSLDVGLKLTWEWLKSSASTPA